MVHVVEKHDDAALIGHAWLRDTLASFDVVATLRTALTPTWTVDREADPCGDLSIVVLPAFDDLTRPTFVLYEDEGLVQVSTYIGETWQSKRAFRTCQRAAAAIAAAAGSVIA